MKRKENERKEKKEKERMKRELKYSQNTYKMLNASSVVKLTPRGTKDFFS